MIQKKQAYASQNEQSKSYGIHISFIRITWNDATESERSMKMDSLRKWMVLKFKISRSDERKLNVLLNWNYSMDCPPLPDRSLSSNRSLSTNRSLSIDNRFRHTGQFHWAFLFRQTVQIMSGPLYPFGRFIMERPKFIKTCFLRSKTSHPHPGHNSYFSLFRIDMKEFVEKYMCPSLNIHLASYCKGRKKPCVRCDSLDTERKTWSFTKCIPNKQLIYDKRGVTDIREVCHKGKSNFCHILFVK